MTEFNPLSFDATPDQLRDLTAVSEGRPIDGSAVPVEKDKVLRDAYNTGQRLYASWTIDPSAIRTDTEYPFPEDAQAAFVAHLASKEPRPGGEA